VTHIVLAFVGIFAPVLGWISADAARRNQPFLYALAYMTCAATPIIGYELVQRLAP